MPVAETETNSILGVVALVVVVLAAQKPTGEPIVEAPEEIAEEEVEVPGETVKDIDKELIQFFCEECDFSRRMPLYKNSRIGAPEEEAYKKCEYENKVTKTETLNRVLSTFRFLE